MFAPLAKGVMRFRDSIPTVQILKATVPVKKTQIINNTRNKAVLTAHHTGEV